MKNRLTLSIDPSFAASTANIVFDRVIWDSSWKGYKRMYDEKVLNIISEEKPGYSRVDFALAYASWIVHDSH